MKNILFLDIDNTLLHPQNIFIYKRDKKGNICIKYTPQEYTKLNINLEDKKYYDYSDFRDKEIIKNSILSSKPIIKTIEIINYFIKNDFELGIITARGQEEVVAYSINIWLKLYLDYDFILRRENIYAINDSIKNYKGGNDSIKKLNVLKKNIKKFNNIFFMDDNKKTIDIINKKKIKNISTIHVDWE